MISQEEIKSFLEGGDPEQYIIAIEFDYVSNSIYKIKEPPGEEKTIQRDTFTPFAWVGDLRDLNFYGGSKEDQKKAMTKFGIVISKLRTDNNDRLENGLKFLVKSLKGYRELLQFFREGGINPWEGEARDRIMLLSPVEQYLVQKEKRLFKGFDEYNDITRLVFDLETTSLEPKDGSIFMIGIKTNRGYHKVIECSNEESEAEAIKEFFKIIGELKPTIIGGYNSANFDWVWIFERAKKLGLDIKKICKSLNPKNTISQSEQTVKLGNEVERYNQVSIWGYNVVDIIHSVRRAQAINSEIKSAGLKYITKFIDAEAEDRVYIDHDKIGQMYNDNEDYWLNIKNGQYRKYDDKLVDLDKKFPDVYIKTTGVDLVERYLDDDLEETLTVDDEFSQASFLLANLIPTTYERIYTMGTAALWKLLMSAWSYKHGLAIPCKSEKRDFVGGLSRLLTVGYSEEVLKVDFSSLYPSIELVHDIFPICDITGALKSFLSYFRGTRIEYKTLAGKYAESDPKRSKSYDRKQLPIKILINSVYGAISAPLVFRWADIDQGEQVTCTGRQYLRQMVKFFMNRGYKILVLDTDGVNFSLPKDVGERKYIGKGLNWGIKEGREYTGYKADVAEYNDTFMRGEMKLDEDGTWISCINLSRKNYATLDKKGKVKLTGNTIKSKKLPLYIEDFLDQGVRLLLEGKGQDFVEYYYQYLQLIYDKKIPLSRIAQRAKVKLTLKEYYERSKKLTKAGGAMSRMAHMELAIKHDLNVKLGDVIYYVNNGLKPSHGDVQKKGDEIILNSYLLNNKDIEENPNLVGEYNTARAIVTFNKRIEPLLIVFNEEVRNNLLVDNPEKRGIFTKSQCELTNGNPFNPEDQDTIEELMTPSDAEILFWEKRKIDPNYIYNLAQEGWESVLNNKPILA